MYDRATVLICMLASAAAGLVWGMQLRDWLLEAGWKHLLKSGKVTKTELADGRVMVILKSSNEENRQ